MNTISADNRHLLVLYVADAGRSRRFYGELLGLDTIYDHADRVGYDAGSLQIMIHPTSAGQQPVPGTMELYLRIAGVGGMIERLRMNGIQVIQEPTDEPWGDRDAGVLDPDGYRIFFSEPIA